MTGRQFAAVLAIVLAVAGCGTDTYESVSKDIDQLMAKQIHLTVEDRAQMVALREQAEQFQQDGKTDDSLKALKQALAIIEKAQDAALLGKSDG